MPTKRKYRCISCGHEESFDRGPKAFPKWMSCWACKNGRMVWATPNRDADACRKRRSRIGFPTHRLSARRYYPTIRTKNGNDRTQNGNEEAMWADA